MKKLLFLLALFQLSSATATELVGPVKQLREIFSKAAIPVPSDLQLGKTWSCVTAATHSEEVLLRELTFQELPGGLYQTSSWTFSLGEDGLVARSAKIPANCVTGGGRKVCLKDPIPTSVVFRKSQAPDGLVAEYVIHSKYEDYPTAIHSSNWVTYGYRFCEIKK